MGRWENECWVWDLRWRRALMDRERGAVGELLDCTKTINIRGGTPDEWYWGDAAGEAYSIRKGYTLLKSVNLAGNRNPTAAVVAAAAWKSIAPFKFQTMAWRAVCNKLPTCDNLSKKIDISLKG
ncbi:hypothetical protein OROMI_026611 [Orobanche minor]